MSLEIESFVTDAIRFCDWLESDSHDMDSVRQILLALMQRVPALKASRLNTRRGAECEHRVYEHWKSDHKRLGDLPIQYYRTVFDPLAVENDESTVGDLHDDLADIYGELWHGLQAYNVGDFGYAVEYWRNSYDQHWGRHAADAICTIDAYFRN